MKQDEKGMTATVEVCALCGASGPLRGSHLIPRFVSRWLKQTSAAGFLRGAERPNQRSQDGPRQRLLCGGCEQLFGDWEKAFAEQLFLPFHAGAQLFQCGEWLLPFAASLAWRALMMEPQSMFEEYPQHDGSVAVARKRLGEYLLAPASPTEYQHHLVFTPPGLEASSQLPKGTAWYLLRAADMTPVFAPDWIATFIKLPGMAFWMYVDPVVAPGWEGTLIRPGSTAATQRQRVDDGRFGGFLLDRIAQIVGDRNVSRAQQERMNESLRKAIAEDPERVMNSGTVRAWLEEERLRRKP